MPSPAVKTQKDDLDKLLDKIKHSSEELDKLIKETTARKDAALDAKKFELAHRCDALIDKYGLQQMILTRAHLRTIDNSQEIKGAIEGFGDVTKQIKATIEQNEQLTKFLNAAASIAGIMDHWIGLFLLAA